MKLVRRSAQTGNDLPQASLAELPDLLRRLFWSRGIRNSEELRLDLASLNPVSGLKSIDKAATLLCGAISEQQTIVVVGDFDADGATATAVVIRALKLMGHHTVHYLVPNRFEYGYGLTPEIVQQAARFCPDLLITVDNGIASLSGVEAAKAQGYRVIITDHHLPGAQLPNADAIVNPNQPGDRFESNSLCGVGVAFYLMLAVKNRLQKNNYFSETKTAQNKPGVPNLACLLDLVALGTVADVVPLDRNNRILVEQGLRRIRSGQCCAGIRALFQIAGKDVTRAVSADLGFVCGPRLNAAGRLDDMSLGIECLLSDDDQQSLQMASALDDLNQERKTIEEGMKADALNILATLDKDLMDKIGNPLARRLQGSTIVGYSNEAALEHGEMGLDQPGMTSGLPAVICLFKEDWHQGVVGIVAARIREKYHRPAIVFAAADTAIAASTGSSDKPGTAVNPAEDEHTVELKGSARSIPGLHIRDILDAVANRHPGLLNKFGGHAMAAGLSLDKSVFDVFSAAVNQVALEMADAETFQEQVFSDGELDCHDFDLALAESLRFAAPWGQHFPAPVFDNRFTIVQRRTLKEKHLRLTLRPLVNRADESTARTVTAMVFNTDVSDWPQQGAQVHLLYQIDVNAYRGTRSLQLIVEKRLS